MIFCVEDDAGIRDLMIYTLNASGFRAVGFENAREFYAALADDTPELIMLDIMLPGEDGISILKRLKADARTADIPVIMATAKGNEYDKVIGLDLGADDYLAKPFGMMEMASRVRAVLRRSGFAAGQKLADLTPDTLPALTDWLTAQEKPLEEAYFTQHNIEDAADFVMDTTTD